MIEITENHIKKAVELINCGLPPGLGSPHKCDEVLTRFADEVLAILIDMKAPGCKWLYLCEEKQ